MKTVIFFLLLIGATFSYIISIDACFKYGPDGRQCRQCITGFQLLNKVCHPRVKGCTDYDTDGQCARCESKAFLTAGKCCDGTCFDKLLKKNPKTNKIPLEENVKKIAQMVSTAEEELPDNFAASLLWIDIKTFNNMERWFLLYRIQNSNTHYQRIVLDYNDKIKTLQSQVVDSSFARIPDEFNLVQWKEVENTQAVLKLFPALYPAQKTFKEVQAKIAVLSEIQQFQIFAIEEEELTWRVLYQVGSQVVVLKEIVVQIKSSRQAVALPKLNIVSSETQNSSENPENPENHANPSAQAAQSDPIVTKESDQCTIHTTYMAPFTGEALQLMDKLTLTKNSQILNKMNITIKPSTTPIIGDSPLYPRRIVMTAPCGNQGIKEVAVVRTDGFSSKQYFDYYLQIPDPQDPDRTLEVFAGNLSKIQPTQIFANPNNFPITIVDPSFVVYPNARVYFQKGVIDAYRNVLTPEKASFIMGVKDDPATEQDRLMGVATRFRIDGVDLNGFIKRKRGYILKSGWLISSVPTMDPLNLGYGDACIVSMGITESYRIGSEGQKTSLNSEKPLRKVTYTGVDIDAELDVNQPLIAAVSLLKAIPNWDYAIQSVDEESESSDSVKFSISAKKSVAVIKAVVSYNHSTSKASLVSFGQ